MHYKNQTDKADVIETKEIKSAIDNMGSAFEEFKTANDARLKAIEEGKGTAEYDEKLAKIEGDVVKFNDLKERLEKMELDSSRPRMSASDEKAERIKEDGGLLQKWMAKGEGENELNQKAVQTGVGADGGVAVPEVIAMEVMRELQDVSPIRGIARVVPTTTSDYKELVDTRGTASGWVGETAARPETGTPQLQEVAPPTGEIYANPAATQRSIEDVFFNVESWLSESVTQEFAKQEGAAFVNGTGTNQPTGFLNGTPVLTDDDSRAFGTLQYVASGAAAAILPDSLLDLVYAPKAGYRANANHVMNRATLAAVRKLKDTDNDYLWAPGLEAGQPSNLLGYGVVEAEDMPDVAAGNNPIAFGDFRRGYLIVDRVGINMLRDPYTNKPFVHFYTTKRVGGIVKDDNAIKLLQIEV